MELSVSGTALRTFARCVTCLARLSSELVLQAQPAKLELHTLNSSRSAYALVSLARDLFDQYRLLSALASGPAASASPSAPLQCSVLLKSVLSVLRTPPAALDRLDVSLPHPDASKLQFTLHCLNGVRKTYWIACSAEPEVQTLAVDRSRFRSHLAIQPRDLARLLSNFQSSLQELTIIATDPAARLLDAGVDVGGKAVELRSYNDPSKGSFFVAFFSSSCIDFGRSYELWMAINLRIVVVIYGVVDDCDTRLHTQLWIDPTEEFIEYVHTGDPVDVTFGMKELKAFLTFCEGCEIDVLLFFEKAGEPVLLVPRFGVDDRSSSDFDATLLLSTMFVSQLTDNNVAQDPASSAQHEEEPRATATPSLVPENVSNHTKIWSELSGSAPKSFEANREAHPQKERNAGATVPNHTSMFPRTINAPCRPPVGDNANNAMQPLQMDHVEEHPEVISANTRSQHHLSNWVGTDDNDDDNEEDEELLVQTTPHYMD